MSAVILNFPKDPWLAKKLRTQHLHSQRKRMSGLIAEHRAALSEYAALPWYVRAIKHFRAWYSNRRLALRQWVLSQGRPQPRTPEPPHAA